MGIAKIQNMWFLNKLSAMYKYRAGNVTALRIFTCQWVALIESGFIKDVQHTGDSLLTVV